jgi:ComF family protein
MPYEKAWVVGERDGPLQRLVGLYKFERAKAAHKPLGDLLLDILPDLPAETVVVPVPTTPGRIRERGYDHMMLIARYVARARGLKCRSLVRRQTNTKQRQATAKKRDVQAKNAFFVREKVDADTPYLIIDDVMTTGATIKYAAQALRDAGAKRVWVAIIARQTLD